MSVRILEDLRKPNDNKQYEQRNPLVFPHPAEDQNYRCEQNCPDTDNNRP